MDFRKKPNMRLMGVVIFVVLVVPIALFLDYKDESSQPPVRQHYERQSNLYSDFEASVSPYRPYTETQLRNLVKDYSTHESVIYNASKSYLKRPNDGTQQQLLKMMAKRERALTQEKMLACFTLAVKDSGKSGERFLKVFRNVYGR